MPMYTFDCLKCGETFEKVVPMADRDQPLNHGQCGGLLVRRGIEAFRIGPPSFVPGAVTSKGEVVPGHFGKAARKKGGRYRP